MAAGKRQQRDIAIQGPAKHAHTTCGFLVAFAWGAAAGRTGGTAGEAACALAAGSGAALTLLALEWLGGLR